ncbi:Aldehyde reductase 2 [Colletotrichum sp. SAR 10_86]|nr:Aldehyde reductase 2 [Colletotrichum sp. SAR 10_75]KAI8199307.1 Aldehyde reductase 2 [Colletotrichum sp. SAR 10_65]KAI8214335.1 Aldehyde reductase 2 [Colletotrichum sp. SAR 10_76]KAI8235891.1 Aldehyde reductase 2 [Colletotrichum sp. SAR 10_86]KAJ5007583.1 Aldehyde reductase 2 [Colletotrichum sp. SAR 10_66]
MSSLVISDPVLPKDSTIVVSGANGFIASHIVDQLLAAGYRVRGTVRDAAKYSWLSAHFEKTYGPGRFTLHAVPEVTKNGAFDEVLKGADGAIHTIAITNMNPDPNAVVPPNVDATLSIARYAASTPSLKRFVYTSSSGAAAMPTPNVPYEVNADTYNEQAVAIAYSGKGPGGLAGGYIAYSAAKTKAEQALWKWYSEEKPGFTLNSIGILKSLWQGHVSPEFVAMFPAQWFCDVVDIARIHIAALLFPDVQSERLIAYAGRFNINDILAVFRETQPSRNFPADLPDLGVDVGKIANERATELMKKIGGGKGWTSLKDCIAPLAKQYAASEAN